MGRIQRFRQARRESKKLRRGELTELKKNRLKNSKEMNKLILKKDYLSSEIINDRMKLSELMGKKDKDWDQINSKKSTMIRNEKKLVEINGRLKQYEKYDKQFMRDIQEEKKATSVFVLMKKK